MKHLWAALVVVLAPWSGIAVGATPAPLADALRSGDIAQARQLLAAGGDVNAVQADGSTALHWAVYRVEPTLVRALLDRGARAEVANAFGVTPLAEAAKLGHLPMVRMLLEAGADARARNADGQGVLMLAMHSGHLDVARELVRAGADVNEREAWRGQTALMWAAGNGKPEVVRFLVRQGAQVDARAAVNQWNTQITSEPRAQYRPTGGMTALLYAARAGCGGCVDALLDGGADIDLPTPDGITPLMVALDNLQFDVARQLLDRGANPHTWDWWGRTPLYIAIDMHSYGQGNPPALELAKALLDKGVNVNPQLVMHRPGRGGNSGRFTDDLLTTGATPLLRAAISGDIPAIQLLLSRGAEVDRPNVMGVTPFMAAAGMGVSIRDPRGNYPQQDLQPRAIATAKVLLEAGADINARATDTYSHTARIARPSTMTDRQGQTALYAAINWGWTDVVKWLLAQGARTDVADARGRTPRDAAAGNAGGRDYRKVEEIIALVDASMAGR